MAEAATMPESKALRLARYLRAFVGLRSTTVYDVTKYESVLWFADMPQEPECRSPAWNDGFEPGDAWLEVHKQQFPKFPEPPQIILPWIDQQGLKRATEEMPLLRATLLVPDGAAQLVEDEEPPLIEARISDYPEVVAAYDRYRPIWSAWSAEHRRRERIQELYAELFRMHTQIRKQGEIVELVLGLGLLDWRRANSAPVLRHLVTARVDLRFEPAAGVMRLHAGADGAQLQIEDDMLEPQLRPERDHYSAVKDQFDAIDDEIWDRARMSTAIRSWVGALDPNSQWHDDLKPVYGSAGKPIVSLAPALILRKRNQLGMARIYEGIISQLIAPDSEIPLGWNGLVEDADDTDVVEPPAGRDVNGGQISLDRAEIFFPLPANREQRRIVEAIDQKRGVLVQGPPGTGKSHTIANLMCHLLAAGKRVLITAETAHALRVLKDKLPREIQPLCVSVLGQGGDSFAELNAAVQGISTRFASWSPGAYDRRIAEIDRELDSSRRSLARIDSELRSLREEEICSHTLANGAYQGTASVIAERVSRERTRFGWLQLPKTAAEEPPITTADLLTWLNIRRLYDDDAISASSLHFVGSDKLVNAAAFAATVAIEDEAREALERFAELRGHRAYGALVSLDARARDMLAVALRKANDDRKGLLRRAYPWLPFALEAMVNGKQALWRALYDQSQNLLRQADKSLSALGSSTVILPVGEDIHTIRVDAAALIPHFKAGGTWKVWGMITPKVVKDRYYLRDLVKVDGQPANTWEKLELVCSYIDLSTAMEKLEAAWEDHGGLPTSSQLQIRLAAIKEQLAVLSEALSYAQTCDELSRLMAAAKPAIPNPNWLSDEIEEWLHIIDATEAEKTYQTTIRQVTGCLRDLKSARDLHNAHPVVGALVKAVEQRDIAGYSYAYSQLCQIEQTRRDQERRRQTESALRVHVPGLVEAVAREIENTAWDSRFADWEEAWRWAVTDNWLQKRSDFAYQQKLLEARKDTEKAIGDLLAEAASLRAWTHFLNRISQKPSIRAALNGWRGAVQAMGKATGRSARLERLRREARGYMDQCREAIPVWIMPRYLVAEMIEPAPARYDLVIVDEASQLGTESLFLFYIAKKMIVVGDDQQISPYGIGISDDAIAGLQQHYLDGIPHHYALSAQSSLYANAKIRFGHNIVLREHFRCMPEIIQFSNDLCYASNGTPLDPLRAYPPNRLQPLVVRHVPDGYRTGSAQNVVNEPEADALVTQLIACIEDPRYSGLSMGVISLQGEAQAKLIEHKLLERIEPEILEERRLICGDAYAFQGDERHIIFLSMVAAPNERIGTLSTDSSRQRFNVAASRAQNQLWLFHSATLDVLSPSCMRYRILHYMLYPERQGTDPADLRFESMLERNVYDRIASRGFHIRTQVCVGDPTNHRYRIDLVVEGMQGRLAVECDGDQWHGPDRYEQDMARQRDLERAGWRFIRIRGGNFYRDQKKALEPLWEELDRLGIRPGGIDHAATEPPKPDSIGTGRTDVDDIPTAPPSAVVDTPRIESEDQSRPTERERERIAAIGDRNGNAGRNPETTWAEPYVAFEGTAGDDPRSTDLGAVVEGLCRIIEVEGPMIAERAYHTYLRGCGIKRMGRELRSTMNKSLAAAIRQGKVVSENEMGVQGLIRSTVRIKGTPPIRVRTRGPRAFNEIPPDELRAVGKHLTDELALKAGTDEHLRAVLEHYDLKRLTAQVGTAILEIIDKKSTYVDELFEKPIPPETLNLFEEGEP